MTKQSRGRLPYDSLRATFEPHLDLHATRLTVLCALIFAMITSRSVVLYTLVSHVALLGSFDVKFKRLKRFMQFNLPDTQIASLVLKRLPRGKHWLIVDRTHWTLGKANINVLLLSVVWKRFSLPLLWTVFPKSGNSSQLERTALLERLLPIVPKGDTLGLMGDREFIGATWFTFLRKHKIEICIRLKSDTRVNGITVQGCFCKMEINEVRYWHKSMKLYGVKLRVMATRCLDGSMLYLAYQGRHQEGLRHYARRWQCENLHQSLKGRGFNVLELKRHLSGQLRLEDSHLTDPARVSTLLGVVSLAFIWCCLSGAWRSVKEPLKVLKHGYTQKSIFRYGLDLLQEAILHPQSAARRRLSTLAQLFDP